MSKSTPITENALDRWVNAHERKAQAVTVDLVAKLVRGLCPAPSYSRFPKSDSMGQLGFDGFLETDTAYPPYINSGTSIWEIGCNIAPRTKLNEDYNKRLDQLRHNKKISQTTFVFVTPRSAVHTRFTIEKQNQWIDSKRADGWKDIKIIDGTLLCEWLSLFPAIGEWLFYQMHEKNCKFITPEFRWRILEKIPENRYAPLTPEIFLCGREEVITSVKDFLHTKEHKKLFIQTRYPNHLPDFISAVIKHEETNSLNFSYDNILIVDKAEDLHSLAQLELPHVFVLGEEGNQDNMVKWSSQACAQGHRLILPKNPGGRPCENLDVLPLPNPEVLQLALEHAHFLPTEAQLLAQKTQGNIPSLLRLLSDFGGKGAYWGDSDAQALLTLASFIGAWNEHNDVDVAFVEEITGKKYEEWKRQLAQLPTAAATPLHLRSDGTCYFVSRFEGWQVGGSKFLQTDLDRFLIAIEKFLTRVACSVNTDPWLKLLDSTNSDKALPSDELIRAMAEILATMASHANFWEHGNPSWLENRIEEIVSTLLGQNNTKTWIQLNPILPLLAEAAPKIFLAKLAEQVGTEEFLSTLSATNSNTFMHHPITGILWALETLSWFPQWLPKAVELLGDLSIVQLPQNLGNRPERSLMEIFSPLIDCDVSTSQSRARLLKILAQKHPKLVWHVLLAISPYARGSISFGLHMPSWREHADNTLLKQNEYIVEKIIRRFDLISHDSLAVLLQPQKLPLEELYKGIKNIPQAYKSIIELFSICVETPLQNKAWEILSKTPPWLFKELSQPQQNILTAAIGHLSPSDSYEHKKKYFGESIPEYDTSIDPTIQISQWHSTQAEHVKNVFNNDGLPGILRLVSMVKQPSIVGERLVNVADAKLDTNIVKLLPKIWASGTQAENIFVTAFIRMSYHKKKDPWLKEIWKLASEFDRLQILLSIPFTDSAWELVTQLPQEDQVKYWQHIDCLPHPVSGKIEYAIDNLITAQRNGDALYWLYFQSNSGITLPIEKIVYLLLHPDEQMVSRNHIVPTMINILRTAKQFCDDTLADIELLWIDVYSNRGDANTPECLNKRFLSDADFFVSAICILYKPRNSEDTTELSDDSQKHLHFIWRALNQLRAPDTFDFSGSDFSQWVNNVLELAKEHDRFEIACQHIGMLLFHAPADACGLWIDKGAAKLLDMHKEMQEGFHLEAINSRGVFIGSQGKEEIKIADGYIKKSNELSREGYASFADCVNKIARDYKNQSVADKERHTKYF